MVFSGTTTNCGARARRGSYTAHQRRLRRSGASRARRRAAAAGDGALSVSADIEALDAYVVARMRCILPSG